MQWVEPVHFVIVTMVAAIALAVGMFVLFRVGRRSGVRSLPEAGDAGGTGAVEPAIFALLGLLIAFTFSGAAERFDARRRMIIDERNAIEAAYLKLEVLPAPQRLHLQERVRRYLDIRLEMYREISDFTAVQQVWGNTTTLKREIWAGVVDAVRAPGAPLATPMLVLPAFTNMFDQAATRMVSLQIHPPKVVYGLLFGLALLSSLLAGRGMARRKTGACFYGVAYSLIISVVVYVIIDLENPRAGLIRVGDFDRVLVELQSELRVSSPTIGNAADR